MSTFLIDHLQLRDWLEDAGELALIDVREAGLFGEGHLFESINVPYSRLELDLPRLVPRRGTRIVLHGDDTLIALAHARLGALGYSAVHGLPGSVGIWRSVGLRVLKGINVVSKTFGEWVEHAARTPSIDATTYLRRKAAGEKFILVDGRTVREHHARTLPGSVPVPNGELALRIETLTDGDDAVPVIVHCGGRTRSIIGAQTLRDLQLPNPVYALEDGIHGWYATGHEPELGNHRRLPSPPDGPALARTIERVAAFASRYQVPRTESKELTALLGDAGKTIYVFDIRTQAEYDQDGLSGTTHVEGGQLLQNTDLFVAVRNARVLILDHDGVRAPVVAHWLRRLGIQASYLPLGHFEAPQLQSALETRAGPGAGRHAATLHRLAPDDLGRWGRSDVLRLDLRSSRQHREWHPAESTWTIRSRVRDAVPPGTTDVLLFDAHEGIASLLALDLQELGVANIAAVNAAAWLEAGLPVVRSSAEPSDAESIDYLFFVHDRHSGNQQASRGYLEWEKRLLSESEPRQLARFNGWGSGSPPPLNGSAAPRAADAIH